MNDVRSVGPFVIAAFGGSGTRVLAGIAQQAGMWIGTNLNRPLDALDFADYCTRWIPIYARRATHPLSANILGEMRQRLNEVVERHLASINDTHRAWGWKNSGSLHLLPFFHAEIPGVRFLHLVRDGRDMAYSPNQYQVRRHGGFLLTPDEQRRSQPLRSIALWSRLNLIAADYANAHLHDRYLLVRFEDLCSSPVPSVQRILDFCGLKADATRIARDQVIPPPSLERWRLQRPQTVARLCEVAGPALQRFGYWDGTPMAPFNRTARERVMAFEQAVRSRLSAGLGGHVAERYRRLRQM